MEDDIQQTPFVKQLAAPDRPTRDRALTLLQTYLSSSQRTLTPLDALKLWKALFYTLWLCDRPIPQQRLCATLATLPSHIPSKPSKSSSTKNKPSKSSKSSKSQPHHEDEDGAAPKSNRIIFLDAFWATMAREWTNIDVLRMEKFLRLVRYMVRENLVLLRDAVKDSSSKSQSLPEREIREMIRTWEEVPLNVKEPSIPNGLRMHVIDIFVDELESTGLLGAEEEGGEEKEEDANEAEDEEKETEKEFLEMLLLPLRNIADENPTKVVRTKAKEALADERLVAKLGSRKTESKEEDGSDDDGDFEGFD